MVAGAAAGLVVVGGVAYAGSANPGDRIVVHAGQTLWGIATQVAPHTDPRATVQQIIMLNHLASTGVQAGETLAVPS